MANSARSRSLSAAISATDDGIVSASCRVVSRTARVWTMGTTARTLIDAARNPMPRYMMDSIINAITH